MKTKSKYLKYILLVTVIVGFLFPGFSHAQADSLSAAVETEAENNSANTDSLPDSISVLAKPDFDSGFVIAHPRFELGNTMDYLECMKLAEDQLLGHISLFSGGEKRIVFNQGNVMNIKSFLAGRPKYREKLEKLITEKKLDFPGTWAGAMVTYYPGEYMARSTIHAVKYLKDVLNYQTNWYQINNLPSFSPQMPQILSKCGINFIIGQKGLICPFLTSENTRRIFRMVGLDGTGIIGYAPALGPGYNLDFVPDSSEKALLVRFCQGSGSHGINAERSLFIADSLSIWNGVNAQDNKIIWAMRPASALAEYIHQGIKKNYYTPVEFSALSMPGKLANTNWETSRYWANYAANMLPVVEKLSVLLDITGVYSYPKTGIDSIWEMIFLDAEPGWGLKTDPQGLNIIERKIISSKAGYKLTNELMEAQLKRLAAKVKRSGKGTAVVVFNGLNWNRSGVIKVAIPKKHVSKPMVTDAAGKIMLSQLLPCLPGQNVIIFLAENIPCMGYKTFYVQEENGKAPSTDLTFSDGVIENTYYRMVYDELGVFSIHDKKNQEEMIKKGSFDFGTPHSFALVEKGPVRVKLHYLKDEGSMEISLCAFTDKVDIKVQTTQLGHVFPMHYDIAAPKLQMGVQYGSLNCSEDMNWKLNTNPNDKFSKRASDNTFIYSSSVNPKRQPQGRYFVPCRWWDLSEKQGDYGITTAYAFSHTEILIGSDHGPHKGDETDIYIRLTGNGSMGGCRDYNFSIKAHKGDWMLGNSPRFGWEESTPLVWDTAWEEKPFLPDEACLIKKTDPNIIVSVIKKCESSPHYIMRLFETLERDGTAEINLGSLFRPAFAFKADMIEDFNDTLEFNGDKINFYITSQSIENVIFNMQKDKKLPLDPSFLSFKERKQHEVLLAWTPPQKAKDGDSALFYKVYKGTELIGITSDTTFRDTGLMEGEFYNYSIYAVDDAGNQNKKPLHDSFNTLTGAPALIGISALNDTTLKVDFDEKVEKFSANLISNYSIYCGINIKSAILEPDLKSVILTTNKHAGEAVCTLMVSNIRDVAPNPNIIKPNSGIEYVYKRPPAVFRQGDQVPGLGIARYLGCADNTLCAQYPGVNYGKKHEMSFASCGPEPSDTAECCFLLYFDVSVIPKSAQINSAKIKLNVTKNNCGFQNMVRVHKINGPWDEETSTWKNKGTGYGNWHKPGGDYNKNPVDSALIMNMYTWDVTELVKEWVKEPDLNNGMIFTAPNKSALSYVSISTSEWPIIEERPSLIVDFREIK
ncbi:MAG: DNRLRE domain-containing protein [bacterium]